MSDFFDDLRRETEEAADESGLPEDAGDEVTLAEGENWTGRFRRQDADTSYGEPRAIYLLTDPEGNNRFIRGRTVLDNQMSAAAPAAGDALAIVRSEDGQNKEGQAFFRFTVRSRPYEEPGPEPAPSSQLGPDDEFPY